MSQEPSESEKFYAKGIELLREFLLDYFRGAMQKPPGEIDIVWDGTPPHGLRISEIGLVWRHSSNSVAGASYMRSEPAAAGYILTAEDFVLEHETKPVRPEGWESDLDLFQDVKDRLKYLFDKESARG